MRTAFALIFFLLLSLPQLSATDIRKGEQVLVTTAVHDDLYVGANSVKINAPIYGDLIAAARFCYVQDTIHEDAILIAQELFLEAPVMDDARLMAGQVHIRADIFGDLFIGGGTVHIDRDVRIHGNLFAGGGTVNLYGTVLGDIELAGGEVFFDGTAEQAANIKAGTLNLSGTIRGPARIGTEKLNLTERAAFYQEVHYWTADGPVDLQFAQKDGATAQFDETLRTDQDDYSWHGAFGIGSALFTVGRILSAVVLLIILVWAFRKFFRNTAHDLIGHYAVSLGYGMLYLLGVPLLILIALVSIIGIPVGIFSLATYGLSLGFAHILTAILVTYWWQEYQQVRWKNGKVILVATGVFVLLKVVSWIPFLGWLISLMAIATTFGAILSELLRKKTETEVTAPLEASELEV
ncbi:bactofilin family protein [Flavilitoribacter nigricans]|uniref:DUF8173 domain-containing protein n=1 Tax=Flavilitoribacter nigricans (strain ATCC 23147 / DSM 23189 / NBRC 102662 / NCIMB 1420 / SS-2) TaxID=1122177 RepID=A0A2D0NI93_FLAN2|nr:polymer-forming cytoskeletal protein [Flavilitoribacter nigricans]PHN08211.1 hypothetical protein CRP01_02495 [Flavilitoribacter nigricans DSM 23189 = NBRC 102662]